MRRASTVYATIVALAMAAYFAGLGGRYAPKNGDESVYFHIARLTAASGQWLPLRSDLDGMRNTKPPMLTWQGIASTHWGAEWSAFRLRWPSVAYTFATALMVGWLAARLAAGARRAPGDSTQASAWFASPAASTSPASPAVAGFVAAGCWLAFFTTYRYGRPFLTNAPEVFWLFAPFFGLLAWRGAFDSRWAYPAACGAAIGVGLLYKSFALLLPVGLGLAWWKLHRRRYDVRRFVALDAPGLAMCAVIALAVFGAWFVLDPDPAAVWREFVIGENAEKFDAEHGYLRTLLWGGSSVWSLAANYPLNAGLLAFPVVALVVRTVRAPRTLSDAERLLWLWVIALFVVFALPSQRSGRYLLSAMPAIAVLLALRWHTLARSAFLATAVASAAVGALLGWLAWRIAPSLPAEAGYGVTVWAWLAALAVALVAAFARRRWTRPAALASVFLVYLAYAATVQPLERGAGQFDDAARRAASGRDVWVPCNFRASYEPYRFALPGANVLGYQDEGGEHTPAQLAERYPRFVAQVPLAGGDGCAGCRVLGERLEIRSRHSAREIERMLQGEVFEHLFVRERLIEGPLAAREMPGALTPGTASQCR